jgi:Na+/melibiose symporter-like transporter
MGQDGTREFGRRSVVSVMNWIGTLIVLAIPVVNIIMMVVWAITCKRASKRNFCIALLILTLVAAALVFAAVALYGDVIAAWVELLDARMAQPMVEAATSAPTLPAETAAILPSPTPLI